MLSLVEAIWEVIYRTLQIVFELYLCIKFFIGNREEIHTLWYGIGCILLLLI